MPDEIQLTCELPLCTSNLGAEYKRKPEHELSNFKGEPIFLCEKHAESEKYTEEEKINTCKEQ